jgi:hypothetical protein
MKTGGILAYSILFIRIEVCENNTCWLAVSAHSRVIKVQWFLIIST